MNHRNFLGAPKSVVESVASNCNQRWSTCQTRSTKHTARTLVPHKAQPGPCRGHMYATDGMQRCAVSDGNFVQARQCPSPDLPPAREGPSTTDDPKSCRTLRDFLERKKFRSWLGKKPSQWAMAEKALVLTRLRSESRSRPSAQFQERGKGPRGPHKRPARPMNSTS